MKKKLPLGIEDFDKIIKSNYYYVDKTGLIKELIENRGMVNWVTRPYRFGKSLNMSMLKCFLEIGCDRSLFDGLMISKEKALCEEFMGKFPVVHINMKEVKSENFTGACIALEKIVVKEALRFYEQLSESNMLNDMEKVVFPDDTNRRRRQYTICVCSRKCFTEQYKNSDRAFAQTL